MYTQLHLEFDQEKLTFMKSILDAVDQRAIIKGLVELYVEFVQVEKSEASKDEKDN
jgi:hypothetical protein